jgi:hypothetical protein
MSDEFYAILVAAAVIYYSIKTAADGIRQSLALILKKQKQQIEQNAAIDTRLSYITLLMKDLPGIKEVEAKKPNPFFTIRPKADTSGEKS